MGFTNKLTNIQALAPSGTATITLGCGPNAPTLDKLQLTLAGTDFDDSFVTGIRGFVNGREFMTLGGGVLHNLRAAYLGLFSDAGELTIDFTEPNARSAIEQNLSCLPLSLMQSCYFEVDIGATNADLSLKALAYFRAPTNNPFIKKVRKIRKGFSETGEQTIFLPNGPAGGKLVRAWIVESVPGNIKALELRARNSIGREGTRAQLENDQKRNGLTPQAGNVVVDFIADGNLSGWFDTQALSDVELKLTGTLAATYDVYLEYLDPINHL